MEEPIIALDRDGKVIRSIPRCPNRRPDVERFSYLRARRGDLETFGIAFRPGVRHISEGSYNVPVRASRPSPTLPHEVSVRHARCRSHGSRILLLYSSLAIATAVGACGGGGPSGPPRASALTKGPGDSQTSQVGATLGTPITVTVLSGSSPMAGATVAFATTAEGGAVTPATVTTSQTGVATTTWQLGTMAGTQTLTATVTGVPPVTFTATALTGPPTAVVPVSGSNQTETIGKPLPQTLVARVTDGFGNPVASQAVTFVVTLGGGSLTGATQVSDADGRATLAGWTLGLLPGFQRVEARVAGANPAIFIAIANPVPPASFLPVAGNNASVNAGTLVPVVPTIEARDSTGQPQPGVPVTFTVTSGGGVVQGATTTTDGTGRASPSAWILGLAPGTNTLTASAFGAPDVVFQATSVAAVPSSIVPMAGGPFSGLRGNYLPNQPGFRLTDTKGDPVAGIAVTFAASDGGSVGGAVRVSDFNGLVAPLAWRLGMTAGPQSLTATAEGLPPISVPGTADSPPVGGFAVSLRFIGTAPTPAQQAAFDLAAERWSELILGDLPDVEITPQDGTFGGCPAIFETIDDIVIFAELTSIDGVGNVLGSAGPCAIRDFDTPGPGRALPVLGRMRFDVADLANLEANGTLRDVVLHEMGHVLGIGSLWSFFDLLVGAGGNGPFFVGPRATAAHWGSLAPGATFAGEVVPVENTGGPGTRDGHWRESSYNTELMTGFIDAQNFLSAITTASLADMGYVVDDALSDPFTFGAALLRFGIARGVELPMVPFSEPISVVDRYGRPIGTIPRTLVPTPRNENR